MDIQAIIKTLHPFEIKILLQIDASSFSISSLESKVDLNEAQIRSGVNWLEGKELIIKDSETPEIVYKITEKGHQACEEKSLDIEKDIYNYLNDNNNVRMNDLMNNIYHTPQSTGSSIGLLKKNGEIIQNNQGYLEITDKFKLEPYTQMNNDIYTLNQLQTTSDPKTYDKALQIQYKKDFLNKKERLNIQYKITKDGSQIKDTLIKENLSGEEISQITPEMLKEKSWKNKKFREYNINLPAPHILIGRKHPYKEYLDFLKKKFISLGFKEMRGSLVETEFWNMDALYMPQTHPARDIHDVYFVDKPKSAKSIQEPYFSNVAETHQTGGKTKSRGWGYHFDKEKAKQLILRSQGTVLSAHQLTEKPDIPGKYFGIARCFRYDKVDATHLADFFQVEGIVLSDHADFPTLLGLLEVFAKEIAKAKEIKYVPGYFPFTEPSVEVHIKHPTLGWYELGGAGIFRPEVTIPLGIDIPVIAWGLGIDRMAMMALGFNDIRDLFSRDLDLIRDTRMVQ